MTISSLGAPARNIACYRCKRYTYACRSARAQRLRNCYAAALFMRSIAWLRKYCCRKRNKGQSTIFNKPVYHFQ